MHHSTKLSNAAIGWVLAAIAAACTLGTLYYQTHRTPTQVDNHAYTG